MSNVWIDSLCGMLQLHVLYRRLNCLLTPSSVQSSVSCCYNYYFLFPSLMISWGRPYRHCKGTFEEDQPKKGNNMDGKRNLLIVTFILYLFQHFSIDIKICRRNYSTYKTTAENSSLPIIVVRLIYWRFWRLAGPQCIVVVSLRQTEVYIS